MVILHWQRVFEPRIFRFILVHTLLYCWHWKMIRTSGSCFQRYPIIFPVTSTPSGMQCAAPVFSCDDERLCKSVVLASDLSKVWQQ